MNFLCASLLALGLCHAGMSALAFAMDRHHAQLSRGHDASSRQRVLLRSAAIALLALAWALCVWAWHGSVGTAAFIGFLSAGALPVALLLPYGPRLAAGLGVASGMLSPIATIAWMAWPPGS